MKFEINGSKWEIEKIPDYEMRIKAENDYTLGLTIYLEQKVYLNDKQKNVEKTLRHELTHVWLYENGHNAQDKEFNHEDVCEIVACSGNFINSVVEKYKEEKR